MGFRNQQLVLVAGALAVGLGGCTTYGTGVTPAKQTVDDIGGLVALGGKKQPHIDYEARAPIVPPPENAALPEPGASAKAANWPRDPDELDRQRKALAASTPKDPEEKPLGDPGFRLPSTPSTPRYVDTRDESDAAAKDAMLKPGEAATAKKLYAAAKAGNGVKVDENGVPVRTLLVEPPSDYRVPDPTAPTELSTAPAKTKKWWWPFGN